MSENLKNVSPSSPTLVGPMAKKQKYEAAVKNDPPRIRRPLMDISLYDNAVPSTSQGVARTQQLPRNYMNIYTIEKTANLPEQLSEEGKVDRKQSNNIQSYSEADLCDCLRVTCQGCFGNCLKCGSGKCGPECRVNRPFYIRKIYIPSSKRVIRNPFRK